MKMSNGHGGNIRAMAEAVGLQADDILDFSANVNPLGFPEWLPSIVDRHLEAITRYPDSDCVSLVETVAARYGVEKEDVIVGNGSTEILYELPQAIAADRVVIAVPAYIDYRRAAERAGMVIRRLFMKEDEGFVLDLDVLDASLEGDDLVFLGQPNNPTGLVFDAGAFRTLALSRRTTLFVVDEAFADFVDNMDSLIRDRPPNVVVLRSLTKFYAVPGLRLGFAVADASLVAKLKDRMLPWSVNVLAQVVGEAGLRDAEYAVRTREFVRQERNILLETLASLPGLAPYAGRANFLFARITHPDIDAPALARQMLRDGVAIRVCDNYEGLDRRFFRVAVRTRDENNRLCEALAKVLG